MISLEKILRSSSRALVVGVGGGGDVVGALAAARFLEFCGVEFLLGGLSWERPEIDPLPGPRSAEEVKHVRVLHRYAWLANHQSSTETGILLAESRMAGIIGREVLLVDINGGVQGVVDGLKAAVHEFRADLLVGVDVGGDSLARGTELGLRSPLADSIMLAAFATLEGQGVQTLWGVFGYGSDGEMTVEEIERALSEIAGVGGLLGAWALTQEVTTELEHVIRFVPTEASSIPVMCARGAWGQTKIRQGQCAVRLTPLATITFFLSPTAVLRTLSGPGRAVRQSSSLEEANEALHAVGLKTELDLEREQYGETLGSNRSPECE